MAIQLVTTKDTRSQESIKLLKEIYEEALKGKILEFVIVFEDNEGYYNHVFTATQDSVSRIGAVSRLQHVLQVKMDNVQLED